MGNSLGGKKTTKVMKINGETMKFKTPIQAKVIVKDYPNHALLDSESVKHYGIRSKPLGLHQNLEPKRLYFLVELPKFPRDEKAARRVRSGINMSAKDRLESLMLSRRSVSNLSIMRSASITPAESSIVEADASAGAAAGAAGDGPMRIRMRLPKAEVERMMSQSRDEGEMAKKVMDLCMAKSGRHHLNGTHDALSTRRSSNTNTKSFNCSSKGKETAFLDEEIRDVVRQQGGREARLRYR